MLLPGAERYGDHETLLKRFWASIGFELGPFMNVGDGAKAGGWFERVFQPSTDPHKRSLEV
jgi:hypothetical protein